MPTVCPTQHSPSTSCSLALTSLPSAFQLFQEQQLSQLQRVARSGKSLVAVSVEIVAESVVTVEVVATSEVVLRIQRSKLKRLRVCLYAEHHACNHQAAQGAKYQNQKIVARKPFSYMLTKDNQRTRKNYGGLGKHLCSSAGLLSHWK